MNERGFFTIVGLCLLIAVAISIKGVHEFEADYSRGIFNVQAEHKLQNLAESYLIETLNSFNSDTEGSKIKILEKDLGNIEGLENVTIEIWGERGTVQMKNGSYTNFKDLPPELPCRVVLSVASCDSPFIVGKIYRRSLAYVLDDDLKTIHFMNEL